MHNIKPLPPKYQYHLHVVRYISTNKDRATVTDEMSLPQIRLSFESDLLFDVLIVAYSQCI
jgi:hypothetical protein